MEALRQDWEQTKLDLHLAGRDLIRASEAKRRGKASQVTRH
jgi:hypothetical protein